VVRSRGLASLSLSTDTPAAALPGDGARSPAPSGLSKLQTRPVPGSAAKLRPTVSVEGARVQRFPYGSVTCPQSRKLPEGGADCAALSIRIISNRQRGLIPSLILLGP